MRSQSYRNVLTVFALVALSSSLVGCPEKGGTDKTTAEPEERAEPAEPDEEGKATEKKPASAQPAPADEHKPDEDKDKGGW